MFLPSALPGSLGLGDAQGSLFTPGSWRYDYAIGGQPFLSAASRENPIVRETAPIRKQQLDTSNTPGEQALDGWWIRAQQSFHGGAGQLFVDPQNSGFSSDTTSLTRFRSSRNVNVWEQGKLTLLNSAKRAGATPIAETTDATEVVYPDGTDCAVLVTPSNVRIVSTVGVNSFPTPSANPLQSVTTDGTNLYISTIDGVWSAPVPATPATAPVWTKIYNITGVTTSTHLVFAKQRLMLGAGPSIYEIPSRPAAPPQALPAAKYTSPDPKWRWLEFSESAAAIYACGNNSVRGAILKFVLDSQGTIPALSAGATAAQLPSGEIPYSIMGYLGDFVGIATNLGVRVAVADGNGNLSYGPILFPVNVPARFWSARDRFLYVGVSRGIDGDSGVYRIDLSTQIQDLRFAYASDISFAGDTSDIRIVAHLGGSNTLMFATASDVYVEDTATLAASGYLQTSRVRFGMLEPKLFKRVKVRGPALGGPLSFQIYDQQDRPSGTFTYGLGIGPADVGDVSVSQPQGPQDFISLRFTFQRSTTQVGGTTVVAGPEMWGYQLKALPGVTRQRMIQLPLLCFDFEKGPDGQRRGQNGSALSRLRALEDLERSGNSVMFQDFITKTATACVIEQINFRQTATAAEGTGFGGIITMTLRTI